MHTPSLVACGLAGTFLVLAALHVRWAVAAGPGGTGAGSVLPTRPDGSRLFEPGRGATLAVAAALAGAAVVVLGRAGVLGPAALGGAYRAGTAALGAVLLLRTVGDFRYVGLFKRERRTRFARLDTRVYTPLCAALAAGALYLAAA